jgi:hypothetical protein
MQSKGTQKKIKKNLKKKPDESEKWWTWSGQEDPALFPRQKWVRTLPETANKSWNLVGRHRCPMPPRAHTDTDNTNTYKIRIRIRISTYFRILHILYICKCVYTIYNTMYNTSRYICIYYKYSYMKNMFKIRKRVRTYNIHSYKDATHT